MDVPLLIDKDGVFSSHGPLTSSLPLFSHGTSNLSKIDDDDVVMFFRNFVSPPPHPPKGLPNVHPPKEGLHIVKFKLESRNGTMTQLEIFKIPRLLASLGKTICKVKWQSAYYKVQNL
jgi:hypothetical protein